MRMPLSVSIDLDSLNAFNDIPEAVKIYAVLKLNANLRAVEIAILNPLMSDDCPDGLVLLSDLI